MPLRAFCRIRSLAYEETALADVAMSARTAGLDIVGVAYRISRLPMAVVLRARAIFETRGFLKALIDARSDRILGFTALSTEAGELIAVVQTAMLTGALHGIARRDPHAPNHCGRT